MEDEDSPLTEAARALCERFPQLHFSEKCKLEIRLLPGSGIVEEALEDWAKHSKCGISVLARKTGCRVAKEKRRGQGVRSMRTVSFACFIFGG